MKRFEAPLLIVAAIFIGFTIALGRRPAAAARSRRRVYCRASAGRDRRRMHSNALDVTAQDFRGSADAPSLQGQDFRAKWGPRAVNELFTYLVQTMPPTNPGALGEEGTLGVTAFLLQINGARAGQQPLTARVETPIDTLLVGPAQAPTPAAGGRGGRGARSRSRPDGHRRGHCGAWPRWRIQSRGDRRGGSEELRPGDA